MNTCQYTCIAIIVFLSALTVLVAEGSWSGRVASLSHGLRLKEVQPFPVITICPRSTSLEDQIREIQCKGIGLESKVKLGTVPQQVTLGVSVGGESEVHNCLTVNKEQSFVGNYSTDSLACDVWYNSLDLDSDGNHQSRLMSWGNGDVWPNAVFQAPSASVSNWRNLSTLRTTELVAGIVKAEDHWLTYLRVERESRWENLENGAPHSKFSVGLAKGGAETLAQEPHYGSPPSPRIVLVCTLFMALATGFGSVPFYFTAKLSKFSEGVAQSAAVGVMIAASYSLIHESEGLGNAWLVLGLLSGMVFIDKSQKFLDRHEEHLEFSGLRGLDAKKVVLFLGIMTLHAVGEGCGVGVSYAGPSGFPKGLLVTLAIGLHNIPEGLAVATVLASKGIKGGELTMWTIVTAIPQPLLAVPAYAFVQVFSSLFPFFAGFAAGCMIWISFAEIIPDALENVSPTTLATATTTSTFAFKALQYTFDAVMYGR